MKLAAALSLLLVLPACATLMELHCGNIDSYGLGADFAEDGKDFAAVQSQIASCRATNAPLSETQARAGWEAGRAAYCTPSNAQRIGREGDAISRICSPAERVAMAEGHRAGRLLGEIDRQIHTVRARHDTLEDRLDALPAEDEDARARLLREIEREERQIERLEDRRFLLTALRP